MTQFTIQAKDKPISMRKSFDFCSGCGNELPNPPVFQVIWEYGQPAEKADPAKTFEYCQPCATARGA